MNRNIDKPITNDLGSMVEFGNMAGKNGKLEASLEWYMKGLALAKELKDELRIKEFSSLIMLSL